MLLFKAQTVITESDKCPKKKTCKEESESVGEGSKELDTCILSSEDSGDEADSETSYGDEESGDDGDLEFLVSGKRVEEARAYNLFSKISVLIVCSSHSI